jgi:cephalosporin-C deacetylase-like acetyl esterase
MRPANSVLIFALYVFIACACNQAETAPSVQPVKQLYINNIRSYLTDVATGITDSSMNDVHSLTDWEKLREQRYQQFLEMLGIDDLMRKKRSDLHVTVTGTVQKKGYRIEKLYFESLPHLYVRANLYIPDSITTPRPAILYVSGHVYDQKGYYQAHPAKFAKLGFVCMITETIQMGEVRGEHWGLARNGWFNWISRGYNPNGVEVWNSIRALDVLTSRSEVDKDKIGITGISGGGSQSWYVSAADPRIKAVAPVCGASTLKEQVGKRLIDAQCDCMMLHNTYLRDFCDIGALIAPRPLLIAQANRDDIYTVEAVRELFNKVRKTYTLYDKADNIKFVETPGHHSYHRISRENIFSFFLDHLMNKKLTPEEAGDIDTSAASQASYDELKVYVNGAPKDDRTKTIQNSFIPLPKAPVIKSEGELFAFRDSVKHFLGEKTFHSFPSSPVSFDATREFRCRLSDTNGFDIYSFSTEKGWRLKVDKHWRGDSLAKKPLMIVLRTYDPAKWQAEAFASELSDDWNVAYFEPRGIGETGWEPGLQWHIRFAGAWTGRTIASMQVYDLLRCIEFCRSLPGVDSSRIGVAAQGSLSAVALYAALMDGKCSTVMIENPPSTQDTIGDPFGKGAAIEMFNCLRVTDVYQMPALILPAKTMFRGTVPSTYKWSKDIIASLSKEK